MAHHAGLGDGAPRATVVIPAHDAAGTLGEQLAALAAQRDAPDFEVVVVLNRCTDASRDVADAWTDRLPLSIVEADERASAAYARNVGAATTDSPYLLFCDADDRVGEDWVAAMVAPLARGEVDVVGGCPVVDRTGLGRSTYDKFYAQLDGPHLLRWKATLYPLGASLGCTRAAFDAVGGYDERFGGAGGEEIDLVARMLRNGARIGVAPDAAFSYRPATGVRGQIRRERGYQRGHALLRLKNCELVAAPSYREEARAITRRLARLAVREHQWRPGFYAIEAAAARAHFRANREVARTRPVEPTISPDLDDFVVPVGTALVGGLAFRAPRWNVVWAAETRVEPWSIALVQALLREGDVVVDCGANVGVLSVAATRCVGATGRVHAFEPDPRTRRILEHNLARHGATECVAVSGSALGASPGRASFVQYQNDQLSSFVAAPSQYDPGAVIGSVDVPIETLDDAVAGPVDFVKIDVEGYEGAVLDGAQQLLDRSPDAVVLFEINPATLRNAGSTPRDVLERFPADRWALWLVDEHGDGSSVVRPLDADDPVPPAGSGDGWYANVLAAPVHRRSEIAGVVDSLAAERGLPT